MTNLSVEFVYLWVGGGSGAESVTLSVRLGVMLGMCPWGMKCIAEEFRILRNLDSPMLQ